MDKQPNLNVYTASAGAGKTYTLTREYLSLALCNPEDEFRHIVAMTFTNKATNEMKERIVEALYELCFSQEEVSLLGELAQRLSLSKEEVKQCAWTMLVALLSDYSAFKVKTIDSFFQEVIRTFAYELNYSGNYKIEMDSELWLHQAILLLLNSLNDSSYKDLRNWISELSEESINEGRGHDLVKNLMRLGRELFKEIPLREVNKQSFPTKDVIREAKKSLNAFIKHCREEQLSIAKGALALIEGESLTVESFKGGTRSPLKIYTKIIEQPDTFHSLTDSFKKLDTIADYEGYFTQTVKKNPTTTAAITRVLDAGLPQLNKKLLVLRLYYNTALVIFQHLSKLGTLSDINDVMYQQGREQNTMLLGNSQHFIHRIIDNAEAPFIYERLGGQLHHLMIDEFQDTARLQYENIHPLLENTLSSGYDNLIVGDIKQSIYKFRNCDRSILGTQLGKDFNAYFSPNLLEYNWRSTPQVIEFNNTLFAQLPRMASEVLRKKIESARQFFDLTQQEAFAPPIEIADAVTECYSEVKQLVPEKNTAQKGGVELYYYDKDNEETPLNCPCNNLPEVILDLIERKGYQPQDIAVLANKNNEIAQVAETLLEYSTQHPEKKELLKFISAKALYIVNAAIIRFFISTLRSLANPSDTHLRALTKQHYDTLVQARTGKANTSNDTFEESMQQLTEELPYTPLYDFIEHLLKAFSVITLPEELPYTTYFLDLTYNFHCDQTADLNSFLLWWDTKGGNSQLPAEQDTTAITLLTIHQSKGLGFPIVLLPYPNWSLFGSRFSTSFIWTTLPQSLQEYIGINLSLVPLEKRSSLIAESFFAKDYYQEQADEMVDRLNLFYVAMTRAKKGLILWLPTQEKETTDALDSLLHCLLKNDYLANLLSPIPNNNYVPPKNTEEPTLCYPEQRENTNNSRSICVRLNAQHRFQETQAVRFGAAKHEVLSDISTVEDIDKAIHKVVIRGELLQEDAQELADQLKKYLQDPLISSWFSTEVEIINEQSILLPQQQNYYRPDRVVLHPSGKAIVIDYKFGEAQSKYHKQVARYMELLQGMGYAPVEGYLWYFNKDGYEIIPVTPKTNERK